MFISISLDDITFDAQGLVPAIAQQSDSGEVATATRCCSLSISPARQTGERSCFFRPLADIGIA